MIPCFSAAVSYTVAEQFNQSIEMEAITRSSRIGRDDGEDWWIGEIENGWNIISPKTLNPLLNIQFHLPPRQHHLIYFNI